MTRNEAREIMMQILYELDASKTIEKDKTDNLADTRAKAAALASERLSGGHIKRGTDLICSILDNLKDIDSSINEFSAKWKASRMPKVDLAIMRLAIGEIRFSEEKELYTLTYQTVSQAIKRSSLIPEIEIAERLTTPGMRIIFAPIPGGFIRGASCLTLSRYSPGVQPNSRTNAL